jgi:hypothetical protein
MADGILEEQRQQAGLAVRSGSPEHVFEMVVHRVLAETKTLRDERDRAET